MKHRLVIAAILTAALAAAGSAGMAQEHQHSMGAPAQKPDMATAMAQAIAAMQAANAHLEQLTTKMNTSSGQAKIDAMADLLAALVKHRKEDLEMMKAMHDQAASQPSGMAGMSHGMGVSMSDPKPAASPAPAAIAMTLRTQPDPLRTGDNAFEVTVKDAQDQPVTDAVVTVNLFMAAMPAMGMPAMRSAAKLAHAGNGVYRGTGQVSMAGRWEVTISAARAETEIGSKKLTLTAR